MGPGTLQGILSSSGWNLCLQEHGSPESPAVFSGSVAPLADRQLTLSTEEQWVDQGFSLSTPVRVAPLEPGSLCLRNLKWAEGEDVCAISVCVLWGPGHLLPPLEPMVKP